MFFIFLGVLIILIGASVSKVNPNFSSFGKTGRIIGAVLILLGLSMSCFVQIEPGQCDAHVVFNFATLANRYRRLG